MKKLLVWIFLGIPVFSFAQEVENKIEREMRAVWIATVANLDWPSSSKLSASEQKEEFIQMLNHLQSLNINTVVVQVRPSGDAFYPSPYEPWSQFLTGEQGKSPSPYYDPLAFMIAETHKRKMEFHAWMNPYRGIYSVGKTKIATNHPYRRNPDWFVRYGTHLYYNPARKEVRDFLTDIVQDLVARYDIDALHMDDYFYPYKIKGEEFPDAQDFAANNRGFADKNAWRRDNVNLIIQQLQQTIKETKPWVRFGISPFGVWRNKDKDPKGSDTQAGITNYDDLHADVLWWMEKGWIDYVVPQLYWHIGQSNVDYDHLLEWWKEQTPSHVNLYIGQAPYKLGTTSSWKRSNEIAKQIRLNRAKQIEGSMFFRAEHLVQNLRGLQDSLKKDLFAQSALLPASKAIASNPQPPQGLQLRKLSKLDVQISWEADTTNTIPIKYYLVYQFEGKKRVGDFDEGHLLAITSDSQIYLTLKEDAKKKKRTFVVVAVDRVNRQSLPSDMLYEKL